MNDRPGYLCPCCGKPATNVDRTTTLPYCIIRVRRCLECGYHHETVEMEMEASKAIKQAVKMIVEDAQKPKAQHAG